jgi:hypothetical protein
LELVSRHGNKDWNSIAEQMGTRNARQCRERYNNYVNPSLRRDSWTDEEDATLIEKFREFGPKWNMIAKFFQDRSDMALRNRCQVINRHQNKTPLVPQTDGAAILLQPGQSGSVPPPVPAKQVSDAIPTGDLFHEHPAGCSCLWCVVWRS